MQKVKALSEKINNVSRTKNNLFDSTITVSMDGTPKVPFEEKLKLLNQPEQQFSNNLKQKRWKKIK